MDPASIVGLVAACSSLTKQCASVVKSLHGLIDTYKSAELIILSVATECETIQFAWGRIETWAQQQLEHIDDFEDVGARLQKSIYCGELVMSALEEELLAVSSKSSGIGRAISLTWNNSVLNEHQHRIRGQVAALQLLLQVLNLPRKEDRIEVLSVKESVFSESDESALSIVPSDRSTHYSLDGNRLSIISDDGDIQYIRLSFEDALFTSHVYKRNYRFPAKQIKLPNQDRVISEKQVSPSNSVRTAKMKTKPSTVVEHDGGDEEFFQDEMVQWHRDLFVPRIATAKEHKSVLEHERRELEKRMLYNIALTKAEASRLLFNASSFTAAIEGYEDSCQLLEQAMIRSSDKDERANMKTTRTMYRKRITELTRLVSPKPSPGGFDSGLSSLTPSSPVNRTPLVSSATSPSAAASKPNTAQPIIRTRQWTPRKKSVAKSDISEPIFLSTTSTVDTVDLPARRSLHVASINPMHERTGAGRSGAENHNPHDTVGSMSVTSDAVTIEEETSASHIGLAV